MAIENDALGWDDPIEATDSEFVVLEPGTYTYRVDAFDRERFDGSEKMGPCPMASLRLSVANSAGAEGTITTRLYLNKKSQWKLTAFFKSAGLIAADAQSTTMLPWDKVLGATGQVKISNHTYNGKTYNDADSFITPAASAAPSYKGL
jgi:hypothetical protein